MSPEAKPTTELAEHLRGTGVAVLADDDGSVYSSVEDAIESLGEDGEVQISVVRGSAAPDNRSGLPETFRVGDVASDVEAYLVDPDDQTVGAVARFEQAKAMAAGLNAAAEAAAG
jgi:hypothetical protein